MYRWCLNLFVRLLCQGVKEAGRHQNALCFLAVNRRCGQFLITISCLCEEMVNVVR